MIDTKWLLGFVVAALALFWKIGWTLYTRRKHLYLEAEIAERRAPILIIPGPPPETFPVLRLTLVNKGSRVITITQVAVDWHTEPGEHKTKAFSGPPFPKKLEESETFKYKVPMTVPNHIEKVIVTDSTGKEWKIGPRQIKERLGKEK